MNYIIEVFDSVGEEKIQKSETGHKKAISAEIKLYLNTYFQKQHLKRITSLSFAEASF